MLEQLSVNVVPVNARPDRPPSPSLQGRNCRDMPDMDADGLETRHFCHRARSCSLKAVCAHLRSTHRRRGVHRLHTVDCRGTFLIPLFAHSFHPRTLLPMHTWTVALRRTRSSVRRRLMDRAPVRFDTRAPCVSFFFVRGGAMGVATVAFAGAFSVCGTILDSPKTTCDACLAVSLDAG